MELKKIELVIYFMLFGYLISSWNELKPMEIGLWCVRMNALVFLIVLAKSLKIFIWNMKKKIKVENQLRPNGSGIKLLTVKLKPELLICYTKTIVTQNLTNRTSAQSKVQICAPRFWNTQVQMRLLFVT
jgi:hypothetical protein